MQKLNEDEKKINLIKCPLPKIIYSTMSGLTTSSKKSENVSNNNTYYFKKITNQSPGLPSLKTNTKFSSSPNKTNYMSIKLNNHLNNNANNNSKNNANNNKMNKVNNNKEIKKQTLKEILSSYGLSKYYDKIVELGLNDNNINSLGLMNKKSLNEFISNLKMFPGHIIKMEQLYQHIKQINSYNKTFSNSNIKNNNENITNNNVNYVTLSFNRNNNNISSKIMHSQSHYKYRFINPTIKPKNQIINNSNNYNTNNNINNNNNNNNNNNINIEINKTKVNQQKKNHKSLNNNKNRSKKKVNNIPKNTFEFPKPVNAGRNVLIKYFFKDLANYANNLSGIVNNLNKTNANLYNNFHNLANNNNDLNQEKKANNFSNTFNENHSSKNNIQEINQSDLPAINNGNSIKANTHYNNSLINNNNNLNHSPGIEVKHEVNKNNKGKAEISNKNNNNDKLDKSRTINNYQTPYNINTFMNDDYIKSINNNINNNMAMKAPTTLKKKDNIKNVNNGNPLQKTQYEISKKSSKININIKLKLPNVMNKTDFQTSFSKPKLIEKNEHQINDNTNKNMANNNNNNNSNNEIVLKKEKTILKMKNKNGIKNNDNIRDKVNTNQSKEKQNEDSNTVVIQSWDDNKIIEEKKPIRLREIEKKNIKINDKENNINKKEDNDNNNINKVDNHLTVKINKKENIDNGEINKGINEDNNLSQKIEIIQKPSQVKEKELKNNDNSYTLEDLIYENLRLNHSFSEDQKQNIYSFDLEFMCRCFSLSLTILIETSKESPHITEINLEALSSSNIKYFFFNETFNDNINLLFDLFDKEVNKDININQISPLDKLESLLSDNDEHINFDINCLKHIKKQNDEILIKNEEEKEKGKEKNGRETFKLRTGLGDIEKDIKFIDEFFSMNTRKKHVINYQYVSEISKNVLCKELSYINEIDSELNGTNNSNINNTNYFNNSNSNNNINDSIRAKKNGKEINTSNIIDNEEMKEIKEINEINDNNNLEEENNTFNNEMNELGIMTEANDDIKKEIKKSASNNSINIGGEDMNNNVLSKKNDINQFDIGLKEDNKLISSPINNNKEDKSNDNFNEENINEDIQKNEKIMDNSNAIIVTINNANINNENIIPQDNSKNNENDNIKLQNKEENSSKNQEFQKIQTIRNQKGSLENQKNNKIIKIQEEEEAYESDYVIDINSIDELTYYLIKRSEIFDEDFNYLIMKIVERRYIPPPEPQTIFDFMADIIILTKMEKEVIILSLIYIERLIFNTGLLLTSRNWRRILLTAMIIASKIWDDNSFENTHFSQVFANLGVSEINTLERIFLELINYKVYVKQSEYFKYLMMIKIIALKYNYNGRQIIPVSIKKNMKYQEFTEAMQNRMRKKVTLNNSAQF